MSDRSFASIEADLHAALAAEDRRTIALLASELLETGQHELEEYRIDAGITRIKAALSASEAIADLSSIALARSYLGIAYSMAGDLPSAMEHETFALDAARLAGDEMRMAASLHNLGTIYREGGHLADAVDAFNKAYERNLRLDNVAWQGHNLMALGIAYQHFEDHEQSLTYFRQAYETYQAAGIPVECAKALTNIGVAMMHLGVPADAAEYAERALALCVEHGFEALAHRVRISLASVYHLNGRIADARALYAMVEHVDLDDPGVRITRYSLASNLAIATGDLDAALVHLTDAAAIATQCDLPALGAGIQRELRDLARMRGDLDAFVSHNDAYARLQERVRGRDNTTRLAMQTKQREIDAMERDRERERALLYSTLPRAVADRMIRGEDVTGDHVDHAAVLFIDVADFTSHTSDMHPSDVVKLLEEIFRSIDDICDVHSVTKVKTIGDSYMCLRGDADAATNVRSVASTALSVMNNTFTWPNGEPIRFRIGMHIGPVTAGVIGTQRLQYDVWGDTVNVASRMESTGEAGRVHVSEECASLLAADPLSADSPTLTPRGMVEVKGKGSMTTYWLEGGRP